MRLNNGILKILINGRRAVNIADHTYVIHHYVNAYACLIERLPSGKYGYRSGCAKKEQKVYAINTMLTCNYINGRYFTNLCNIRCTYVYQTWHRNKNFLVLVFIYILKKKVFQSFGWDMSVNLL